MWGWTQRSCGPCSHTRLRCEELDPTAVWTMFTYTIEMCGVGPNGRVGHVTRLRCVGLDPTVVLAMFTYTIATDACCCTKNGGRVIVGSSVTSSILAGHAGLRPIGVYILPWPKKLRQAHKPNIGTCMLDRSRASATCARLSHLFWPG